MIGEPFHELSPGLIYGTFTVLVVLCPVRDPDSELPLEFSLDSVRCPASSDSLSAAVPVLSYEDVRAPSLHVRAPTAAGKLPAVRCNTRPLSSRACRRCGEPRSSGAA